MLAQALPELARAADIEVAAVLAEQIDALIRRIARQCGCREGLHAHEPLKGGVQGFSIFLKGRFHDRNLTVIQGDGESLKSKGGDSPPRAGEPWP